MNQDQWVIQPSSKIIIKCNAPSLLDLTSFHRDDGGCTGIGGLNYVIVVTHG